MITNYNEHQAVFNVTLGYQSLEDSLISSIINLKTLEGINPIFTSEYFNIDSNKRIYTACLKLIESKEEITTYSLSRLANISHDEIMEKRLNWIATGTIYNLSSYLIQQSLESKMTQVTNNPELAFFEKQKQIKELLETYNDSTKIAESSMLIDMLDIETSTDFVRTNIEAIDDKLQGLVNQGLITLAGRPKMGKTSLALTIATQTSKTSRVAFLSLEMSKSQIVDKIKYMYQKHEIKGMNLEIVDDVINFNAIQNFIRQSKAKDNTIVFFIDYLQIISSGMKTDNEVSKLTHITTTLKQLAKELDITIVIGSQFSRGIESRDNKYPLLSDLKGSGSIEQDSDLVIGIHRDDPVIDKQGSKTVLSILANRHGSAGVISTLKMYPSGLFREESQQEFQKAHEQTLKNVFGN